MKAIIRIAILSGLLHRTLSCISGCSSGINQFGTTSPVSALLTINMTSFQFLGGTSPGSSNLARSISPGPPIQYGVVAGVGNGQETVETATGTLSMPEAPLKVFEARLQT